MPDVSVNSTRANGKDKFGFWCGLIDLEQARGNLPGHRPGDQKNIGMPWRTYQLYAKPLRIIIWSQNINNLNIAPVTRPGIDMVDPECFGESFSSYLPDQRFQHTATFTNTGY